MKRKILLSLVAGLILPLFAQRTFPIKDGKLLSDLDGGAFAILNVNSIIIDGVPVTSNLLQHLGYTSNIEEQFEINVVKGYSVLQSTDEDVPTNTFFTGIFNTAKTLTNTTQNLEVRHYTLSNSVDYVIESTNDIPALVVDSVVTNDVLVHTFTPVARQYWTTNYFNTEIVVTNTQITLAMLVLSTNFFESVPTSIPASEYVHSYEVSGMNESYAVDVMWKFPSTTNYYFEVNDPLDGVVVYSGKVNGTLQPSTQTYVFGTNTHVLTMANVFNGSNLIPCQTNAIHTSMTYDYAVTTNKNVITNYTYTTVPDIVVVTNNLTYSWKGWVISELGSTNILYFQSSPRSAWFINNSDTNKTFMIKKDTVLELNTIPLSYYRMEKDSFFARFKSLAVGLCIGNAYAQEVPYAPPMTDLIEPNSSIAALRQAVRQIQEYINGNVEEEYVEEEVEDDPPTGYKPTGRVIHIFPELPSEEDYEEAAKELEENNRKKEEAQKEGNNEAYWDEILEWSEELENDIMDAVESKSAKKLDELKIYVDTVFEVHRTHLAGVSATVKRLGTDFETLKNDTATQYNSFLDIMNDLGNRMALLENKQTSVDDRIAAIQTQVNRTTPNIQNIYYNESGDGGYSGGGCSSCSCDTSSIEQVLEEMGLLLGDGFGDGNGTGTILF